MKVVYVGPVAPFRGGAAHYGQRLIEALERAGHQVEVLSWQRPGRIGPPAGRDDRIAPWPDATYPLYWNDPRSWGWIGRRARRADLLIAPWIDPRQAPSLRTILQTAAATPSVVPFLRGVPTDRTERWLTHWTLHQARAFIVHSTTAEERLRELMPAGMATVVPHPPTLAPEPRPLPRSSAFRLLVFGSPARKDLTTAVRAVAELTRRGIDVHCTVAGDLDGAESRWRPRANEVGIGDRFELRPGYVPDGQVAALLGDHHALLAAYRSCPGSGTPAFANACARPVVGTAVGALAEDMMRGRVGVLAPPRDPGALADATQRVMEGLADLVAAAPGDIPSWDAVAGAALSAAGDLR